MTTEPRSASEEYKVARNAKTLQHLTARLLRSGWEVAGLTGAGDGDTQTWTVTWKRAP